jgi:hypothetical protein
VLAVQDGLTPGGKRRFFQASGLIFGTAAAQAAVNAADVRQGRGGMHVRARAGALVAAVRLRTQACACPLPHSCVLPTEPEACARACAAVPRPPLHTHTLPRSASKPRRAAGWTSAGTVAALQLRRGFKSSPTSKVGL